MSSSGASSGGNMLLVAMGSSNSNITSNGTDLNISTNGPTAGSSGDLALVASGTIGLAGSSLSTTASSSALGGSAYLSATAGITAGTLETGGAPVLITTATDNNYSYSQFTSGNSVGTVSGDMMKTLGSVMSKGIRPVLNKEVRPVPDRFRCEGT